MRLEALIPVVLLAACNTAIGTEVSRSAAKSVVNPIVAERFPGVPLEPTTDCIIDNASGDEIVTLATSAATRDDQTATQLVLDIARRPDTIQCIATNGLPVLINTL
ncbi:hypothetical protein [Jannaschia pohangensis]|uniref:Succinate dehydrogenase n=1 Tax=Jannaschia pohangensis TaxID=390807 RepID=A0A1I3QXI5_9RHOB|nr:hypothetical protein [Jannaschia pohangensis]SFJ38923.1 hypothetical protein SAMN04488095_2715 [Jannaschia pohangensis]